MLRRVALTLVVVAAAVGWASVASAQTTTTGPVVTSTTPTTVARTTVVPTTRPRVTTTTPASTTTSRSTSTTVADAGGGDGISGRTIALIVGAIAVAVLLVVIVVLLMRRRGSGQWRDEAVQAAAEGRSVLGLTTHGLATLDQPAFAAQTWSDLDAQGAQLHQRLQGLARKTPPDEWAGSAVTRLDHALQALRSSVEADRALRLGPPPPTAEQLGYSEAVVRQRATDFEQNVQALESSVAQVR
ncbi:MAG: hypothetical protein H0T70_04205 [Acidimicrobiia bacterium]|nr:hypothetical protein [Acidimicrobiia bacterium]